MNLEQVFSDLGEGGGVADNRPHWDESVASFPGTLDFLQPDSIRTSLAWCGFPPETEGHLLETARKIQADRRLQMLAWHYFNRVFVYPDSRIETLPTLRNAMGEHGPALFLLVALAMVPLLRACHAKMGVPETVTRETCAQVRCFCQNYQRAHHGQLGLFPQIGWLKNYVNGSLYFRFGRLEFWAQPSGDDIRVFRHGATGRTVALAPAGCWVDGSGFIHEASATSPLPDAWQTTGSETSDAVVGHPIDPRGFVCRPPVRLPLSEWRCVLQKGTSVLALHIPAGGQMSLPSCGDALRRAVAFFARYFPERAPVAVTCSSWIFSPVLERILPADANMIQFMRELYLCPAVGRGVGSLWFVFLQTPFNPATAPRETSLQRTILQYLEAGNDWRDGRMFFLIDDLPHFGTQWYRRSFLPTV